MATLQSSSLLARTRSGRVPANSGKPLVTATTAGGGGTTGALPSAHIPSTTSNTSLFLMNLRLLELDMLPDWPDINNHTFSTKDAGQGQKKRIQCVEWALYQLFALWDPDGTRNKLQPFFPPLDQVQSLNLRAALLRALEQAKKNGILGRDAVVRKTLLDECKGERLEEVLAVFSSAVLKKLATEDQLNSREHPAIAQTLALENRGYSGERTHLNALILAHKASLTGILREKKAARARFNDFSELLDLKHRSIARRREQVKALGGQAAPGRDGCISDDAKLDVWRTVRNNWSGHERWMESLLDGDTTAQRDGLLSVPFDRVWRRVQSGRLSELEDRSGGLFEQLDRRVKVQRERLERWQSFRKKMFGKAAKEPAETSRKSLRSQKGIDLGFEAHENLHLGRLSPRKLPSRKLTVLSDDYRGLVDGLEAELSQINKASSRSLADILPSRRKELSTPSKDRLSVELLEEDSISELSELEEPIRHPILHQRKQSRPKEQYDQPEPVARKSRTFDLVVSKPPQERSTRAPRPRSSTMESSTSLKLSRMTTISPPRPQLQSPPISPIRSPVRTPSPARSPTRRPPLDQPPLPQSPEQLVSPTQELADQILASMNNTSPSPVKKPRHTLSLAERTRLSMVRGPRAAKLDDDDEVDFETLSIRRNRNTNASSMQQNDHVSVAVNNLDKDETQDDSDEDDLVARTRKSMAGFEAARQKAQLDRRRSQRKSRQTPSASVSRRDGSSYFPVVEEGDSTLLLAEELMSADQEDAEAIFRSRPKIKTSPVPSPAKACD